MEADVILSIVNSVGFPMACVIACGWFIAKKDQTITESNNKREDRMFEQVEKFSESLDKFNETLKSIDNRLAVVEEKIGTQINKEE